MVMVDALSRIRVETRNRAALILLDSNFEIALKEYIVTNKKAFPLQAYSNKKIKGILGQRTTVIREVQAKVPKFSATMASKADFYYGLRNQLIHERTTVPINDRQVEEYRKLIESVLKLLFGLKFPTA